MDSLDVERLIGSVISGALGGRRKRGRAATRFLTGGRSSFLNASTLLALGGLAWGAYETLTQSGAGSPAAPAQPPPAPPRHAAGAVVPPPLPTSAGSPPPLPGPPTLPGPPPVSAEVLRVLRLTLSAARGDGELSAVERDAILAQARTVGAEALIAAELHRPRPLSEIATGVADPAVRADLYTLAFSIVRADEQVLDQERRYLDELARHLELDATTVARLEQQAADRITAAGTS